MPQRDKSYLYDILEALNSIRAFITGVDHDSFVENDMLLSAVIRKLEIIGEATKRLSQEFRAAHTGVPWKKMAGTKDVLIHDYDGAHPKATMYPMIGERARWAYKQLKSQAQDDLTFLIPQMESVGPEAFRAFARLVEGSLPGWI